MRLCVITESTSDTTRLNDKLLAYLEGPAINDESQSEKKKSGVHFNELVERIEVIADDDIITENPKMSSSSLDGEYSRL